MMPLQAWQHCFLIRDPGTLGKTEEERRRARCSSRSRCRCHFSAAPSASGATTTRSDGLSSKRPSNNCWGCDDALSICQAKELGKPPPTSIPSTMSGDNNKEYFLDADSRTLEDPPMVFPSAADTFAETEAAQATAFSARRLLSHSSALSVASSSKAKHRAASESAKSKSGTASRAPCQSARMHRHETRSSWFQDLKQGFGAVPIFGRIYINHSAGRKFDTRSTCIKNRRTRQPR